MRANLDQPCPSRPPRFRHLLQVAAALLLATGAHAAQQVWVVDPAGGGDFTTIQPAVDAAADGDVVFVRDTLGPGKALQGNLDPAILLAGPDATRAAARDLLARVPAEGHIVNLGHGILPETPIESVEALIEVVHGEAGGS